MESSTTVTPVARSIKSSCHSEDSGHVWLVTIDYDGSPSEGCSDCGHSTSCVFGSEAERDRFLASATMIPDSTDSRNGGTKSKPSIVGYSVQRIKRSDATKREGFTGSETAAGAGNGQASPNERTALLNPTQHQQSHSATKHNDNFNQIDHPRSLIQGDDEEECYSDFNELSEGFDALVKRFELFRRVIEHEDDLLNQRMSWIILAQSFLMAAFISSGSDNDNNNNRRFLSITAAVGLLTCLVTLPALVAAGKNIEVQQHIYFAGIRSDSLCQRLHGHGRDRSWGGDTEHKLRSSSSHLLPNTAFRSRLGVPILTTVVLLSIVQVAGWCGLLIALMMVDDDR